LLARRLASLVLHQPVFFVHEYEVSDNTNLRSSQAHQRKLIVET
jgi:hypothetical protein